MAEIGLKVLMPENKICIAWNILLTIITLSSSLILPYRVLAGQFSFDWIYWFITFVFLLDVFFGFNMACIKGIKNHNRAGKYQENICTDLVGA